MIPDRLPPQNLDAEKGVIGGAILDNEVLHEIVPLLRPEHFYRDTHQILWRVIRDLYCLSKPIDSIIIEDELRRTGELAKAGGLDAILDALGSVPHSANSNYYAQIVLEKSIARDLVEYHNQGLRDCYSNNFTADELLSNAERGISALSQGQAGDIHDIKELVADSLTRYEARKQGEGFGLMTGISALDDKITGMKGGELVIVAARPSAGKTALALNILENVTTAGEPTAAFLTSLEMGAKSLSDRLITARAQIDGHQFRSATLDHKDESKVRRAAFELSGAPIYIDDRAPRNVDQITSTARRMKMSRNIGVVIVDYLTLVESGNSKGEDDRSRQEQIAKITRRLKNLATNLDVPVVLLSQLNRGVENREDKRPRMSDLRESGAIEQDADIVLLMYRPDYYDPMDRPGYVELNLAKNRNGPTGVIELFFRKDSGKFLPFSPETPPEGRDDHPF
jgi:replicative DNA helicase